MTGAASGSVGGSVGGAVNSATTQLVDTGTIDASAVGNAALTGAAIGGLGGAISGQIRANAANATLGSSRANTAFTSTQPGERAAAVTSVIASILSATTVKAAKSCQGSGNC